MQTKRQKIGLKVTIYSKENRKCALRKKYNSNEDFRSRMLKQKKCMYMNAAFKSNIQMKNKNRYHENILYRSKQIRQNAERVIQKYASDLEHRKQVLHKNKNKYFVDLKHREEKKKSFVRKYMFDDQHREHMKNKGKERYRKDIEYKESVKRKTIEKYKTDFEHRMSLKQKIMKKYEEDETYRLKKKVANAHRYRTNQGFKAEVQQRAAKRYQTNADVQLKVKNCSKSTYQSSETAKRKKKDNVALNRKIKKLKLEEEGEVVIQFKQKLKEGPDYVCCCCHRILFKKQVQACEKQMYDKTDASKNISEVCLQEKYLHTCSDSCPEMCTKSSMWICFTCHRKILSGKLPAEAVANCMNLEDIPPELSNLNNMEQHLIAMHIPFMKVMALPHGGQKNIFFLVLTFVFHLI